MYTFFFLKQVFYKQRRAQIAKNFSTLLSTLSASDLLSKAIFLEKIVANCKKICHDNANLVINFTKLSLNSQSNHIQLKFLQNRRMLNENVTTDMISIQIYIIYNVLILFVVQGN